VSSKHGRARPVVSIIHWQFCKYSNVLGDTWSVIRQPQLQTDISLIPSAECHDLTRFDGVTWRSTAQLPFLVISERK